MNDKFAMQTVVELIRELKIDHTETPIEPTTRLDADLGIRSLDKLILLTRMEERSKLQFSKLSRNNFEFDHVEDLVRLLVECG
jgi:acyl carrier protein